MNLRKIKLALTIGLINKSERSNILKSIKELLKGFNEVGTFLDTSVTNTIELSQSLIQKTFAIRYENLVLDVNVVTNTSTRSQHIQGFNIR